MKNCHFFMVLLCVIALAGCGVDVHPVSTTKYIYINNSSTDVSISAYCALYDGNDKFVQDMDTVILIPKDESRATSLYKKHEGMLPPLCWLGGVSLKDSAVLSNGLSEVVYYRYRKDSAVLSNGDVHERYQTDKIYSLLHYKFVCGYNGDTVVYEYKITDEDFK